MPTLHQPDEQILREGKPGDYLEGKSSRRPRIERICLVFLSLVAGVFMLRYAAGILVPFVLSLLIFYALDPVVSWCSGFGVPRFASSILIIGLLLAGAGYGAYALRDEASDLFRQLPEAVHKVTTTIQSFRGKTPGPVAKVQQVAGELEKAASEATGAPVAKGVTRVRIEEPLFRASDFLWSGSVNAMWLVSQGITILFLVFFLLAAGDRYKRKLVEVVGPRLSRKRVTVKILNQINEQIGRFLLVQALTSAVIGVAMGIALWLLGVNQAAMWGFSAGVLNSIPYFGTIIVTGALTMVAFLQFGTLGMVAAVAGITLFITSIDGFLLTPFLTGRFSKMNSLAVFASLLFWGWLWGALGMLLAVPIMMAVKSVCDHIEGLQPVGHLLGEDP